MTIDDNNSKEKLQSLMQSFGKYVKENNLGKCTVWELLAVTNERISAIEKIIEEGKS